MAIRASAAPGAPSGLLAALRAAGGTLGEMVCVRGALLAVEAREEIERRKHLLLLGVVAFAFLHAALLLLTLFAAVVFWDTHRIAAVGTLTALYLAAGGIALARFRIAAAACPPPFAASLAELDRDVATMRGLR